MSIKVGMRVRPFNSREVDLGCKLCVDMSGQTTRLLDLDDPKKNRDFTFDYSFWSHDQFHVDEHGYNRPDGKKYADQQIVFEAVGLEILQNAWNGYHCCLFAYGQTGAGKSYSMVGYGANKGIVPISFQQIFRRIKANTDKHREFEVSVSMLQIYNEKVQDLLIPVSKRPKEGLKIREHKVCGVYVEGLTKYVVDSYEAIEAKMEEGNTHRSVAATDMNASSSRAHTIICLEFRQHEVVNDRKVEKLSVIYLVDLAGSEKVGKTNATGDRLKEASGINKSLTVLGKVISDLADKAVGKNKGTVVPYRESCLTRILQNALGGNSKTLMICAISPATDNYQQTLSTLRYADQAKKIQNKAVVNESDTDKMIRVLSEENEKLRKFMESLTALGLDEQKLVMLSETRSQIDLNKQLMMTTADKIKEEHSRADLEDSTLAKVDTTRPYLVNLNEDPLLSKKVKYSLDKPETRVGKKNEAVLPDIVIGSLSVRPNHARFLLEEASIFVEPLEAENYVFLNGKRVEARTLCNHLDRVIFGSNSAFLVVLPGVEHGEGLTIEGVDYEMAIEELGKESTEYGLNTEVENRKLKEETSKANEALKEAETEYKLKLKKMEEEMEGIKLEQEKFRMEKDLAQRRKIIVENENQQKNAIKEKYFLEHTLSKLLPMVIEVNLIANEFKRNVTLKTKLQHFHDETYELEKKERKPNVIIEVNNKEAGYNYFWSLDKFNNRYFLIKDKLEEFYEYSKVPSFTQDNDPFWDPPEPILIGQAYLNLFGLPNLIDNPTTLHILGDYPDIGSASVNVVPSDETGTKNLGEELDSCDEGSEVQPTDLLGKPFDFLILVDSIALKDKYKGVYLQYTLWVDDENKETFRTPTVELPTNGKFEFNYRRHHRFENFTQNLLNYLLKQNLVFKIIGNQLVTAPPPPPRLLPTEPAKVTVKPVQKPAAPASSGAVQTHTPATKPAATIQQRKEVSAAANQSKKDKDCRIF